MLCFWSLSNNEKDTKTTCKNKPEFKLIVKSFYKKLRGEEYKCPFCGGVVIFSFSKEITNEKTCKS